MKKNLLSILILALLIVNIIMTAVMMFSVVGSANKTAALVSDISGILQLEVGSVAEGTEAAESVSIADIEVYDIEDQMTIPLKKGADGSDHFALVSVSLSMNMKDEGYKTYGATVASKESLIKSAIIEVIGTYTIEELQESQTDLRKEILERIQSMFDSKFIFEVSFRDIMFQ